VLKVASYDWIIGIGIVFGLGVVMSYVSYKDILSFLVWSTVISCFVIYGNMLPAWVMVLFIVIDFAYIYFKVRVTGGSKA